MRYTSISSKIIKYLVNIDILTLGINSGVGYWLLIDKIIFDRFSYNGSMWSNFILNSILSRLFYIKLAHSANFGYIGDPKTKPQIVE